MEYFDLKKPNGRMEKKNVKEEFHPLYPSPNIFMLF